MKIATRPTLVQRFNALQAAFVFAVFVCAALVFAPAQTLAQKVSAQVSTDKTYVGAPIVLQLQINNATKYSLPGDFKIDGCDVQQTGSPSQSSRISIINGQRYERRSITMQYLITPRKPGNFRIPRLALTVDGETVKTKSMTFAAEKSETGDLLLVEILGKNDQVYVGQPLDLTLKIWIRPFRDRANNIKFNATQMWQSISNSTTWAAFEDSIQNLRQQRARPSAKTVTRKNKDGQNREYFVYEIDATIYPTKPGKIDANDVQIVVNYPVEIGRSKDPFESMLGGGSPFGRMMDDDFFGSPFRSRLQVTKTRPITAKANVDSTRVIPVPEEGKPSDYRGAVGQYRMIAQASPKTVDAGDPITLKLGIVGDGPMALVQAPPLSKIAPLTENFQVVDQSLAGYVQDNTKAFVTSIRPRSKNVNQIPAIPFCFFDPNTESYKTVFTDPIPITVSEAEVLSLDSIVGNDAGANQVTQSPSSDQSDSIPNFENKTSPSLLKSSPPPARFPWRYFAFVPPTVWLLVLVATQLRKRGLLSFQFRSPVKLTISKINAAQTANEIRQAMLEFISSTSRSSIENESQAAGILRTLGLASQAIRLESIFSSIERIESNSFTADRSSNRQAKLVEIQRTAAELVDDLSTGISKQRRQNFRLRPIAHRSTATLLAISFWLPCSDLLAQVIPEEHSISQNQLELLLAEASQAYQNGLASKKDKAVAKSAFEDAAQKYQLIVDAGVRNADLFLNLGNARLQAGNRALAIASYHRALRLDPESRRAHTLLRFAQQTAQQASIQDSENSMAGQPNWIQVGSDLLAWPVHRFGQRSIGWIFAVASIAFWGLLVCRALNLRQGILKWTFAPAVIMMVAGVTLAAADTDRNSIAVILPEKIELRTADGEQFPISFSKENASGTTVDIVAQRTGWAEIQFPDESRGWTQAQNLEIVY